MSCLPVSDRSDSFYSRIVHVSHCKILSINQSINPLQGHTFKSFSFPSPQREARDFCLESQGCQFDHTCLLYIFIYILFFCLVLLLFLSFCLILFCFWPILLTYFSLNLHFPNGRLFVCLFCFVF